MDVYTQALAQYITKPNSRTFKDFLVQIHGLSMTWFVFKNFPGLENLRKVKRWRFGAVGSDVGRINEVTLRRAQLVLGWVTVSGFNSHSGKFISV